MGIGRDTGNIKNATGPFIRLPKCHGTARPPAGLARPVDRIESCPGLPPSREPNGDGFRAGLNITRQGGN